jgi:thioredoxin-like negative regulator of GroEL
MPLNPDFQGFCLPISEVSGSEAIGRISSSSKAVVKFFSPDCGHCVDTAPKVQAASCPHKADIDFMSVNVDENPEIADKYKVESIPHVVAFKNGKKVDESVGANDTADFAQMFAKLMGIK